MKTLKDENYVDIKASKLVALQNIACPDFTDSMVRGILIWCFSSCTRAIWSNNMPRVDTIIWHMV